MDLKGIVCLICWSVFIFVYAIIEGLCIRNICNAKLIRRFKVFDITFYRRLLDRAMVLENFQYRGALLWTYVAPGPTVVISVAGCGVSLALGPSAGKELSSWLSAHAVFEPLHVETNKMTFAPSDDSDQPGHAPSLIKVFAVRMKEHSVLSYPLSACENSDQTVRMPRLIWVIGGRTDHFVGFVMRRLIHFDCSFPVWCLGPDVKFDCIGSWSLQFRLLVYIFASILFLSPCL